MKIRIHHITPSSFVDGPGERTVLFVQGCPIRCPACQNQALWDARMGRLEEVEQVAKTLALLSEKHGNVTLSGGEVFAQPAALAQLVTLLRKYGVRHILIYTGYTWEELLSPAGHLFSWARAVCEYCDVLVDGRFEPALDDERISYRGSRNQRPIDVAASLESGRAVLLDWDAPELVIDPGGDIHLPVGLSTQFDRLGAVLPSRMCGQTAPVAVG